MKTTILIAFVMVSMLSLNGAGVQITDRMLSAICHQESKGKNVMGDLHLPEKSYGAFQIRRQYLEDVSRIYGKEMVKTWGKKLTLNDLWYSKEKSQWVVSRYLQNYGTSYEKRTGKKCNDETLIRIHNGGPRSAEPQFKKLYAKTTVYKNNVMRWYGKI